MITKFKLFEVKLRDQFILHRKSNKSIDNNNHPFDDATLIREIDIDGHVLKFNWNHTINHNLYDKIKKRTNIKCICELNNIFEKAIRQIIPSELGTMGKIKENDTYAMHFKENGFYIIIDMSKEDIINGYRVDFYGNEKPYSMYIRTIINNSTLHSINNSKIIEINDEYFNL